MKRTVLFMFWHTFWKCLTMEENENTALVSGFSWDFSKCVEYYSHVPNNRGGVITGGVDVFEKNS